MKKNNYSLSLAFLFILGGCSMFKNELISTSNKRGYKIAVIKENSKQNRNELMIKGRVFDVKTGSVLNSETRLDIVCFKILASSEGEYTYKLTVVEGDKIKLSKEDYFFIEAISLGYKTIRTDYLEFDDVNEVQIDFYLEQEDRPLINCEGVLDPYK
ncbi:hypothetical protein [Flavobacterium sp. CLA17]|uniref:hypothetical protein n=1 Tax=Flavobacterium sp. CLA17 TaxID=2724135 RepID=UPI001490E413|nr:hypothetical protein [Flavobacterium sp. CLA17]QSB26760.1 hypothetical protein HAV12_020745 [Flavobacterium sp. CLA17]